MRFVICGTISTHTSSSDNVLWVKLSFLVYMVKVYFEIFLYFMSEKIRTRDSDLKKNINFFIANVSVFFFLYLKLNNLNKGV